MKKSISTIILLMFFIGASSLKAEDLLPSDAYYKDHIAVNQISATSPTLRGDGSNEDDDDVNPGGRGTGNGGQVNSPIGDAIVPVMLAGLFYASFLLYKRRRISIEK